MGRRMRGWSGVMARPLPLWEPLRSANLKGVDCPDNSELVVQGKIIAGGAAMLALRRKRVMIGMHGEALLGFGLNSVSAAVAAHGRSACGRIVRRIAAHGASCGAAWLRSRL